MVRLTLKVSPKASRNAVTGWIGDTLKVSVTAAPDKGKANEAVIGLLAAAVGLPKSSIRLLHGQTSPRKTVEIDGLAQGEILRRLGRTSV